MTADRPPTSASPTLFHHLATMAVAPIHSDRHQRLRPRLPYDFDRATIATDDDTAPIEQQNEGVLPQMTAPSGQPLARAPAAVPGLPAAVVAAVDVKNGAMGDSVDCHRQSTERRPLSIDSPAARRDAEVSRPSIVMPTPILTHVAMLSDLRSEHVRTEKRVVRGESKVEARPTPPPIAPSMLRPVPRQPPPFEPRAGKAAERLGVVARSRPEATETTVEIHIGRIEVRAHLDSRAQPAPGRAASAGDSRLSDHLRRRTAGARS